MEARTGRVQDLVLYVFLAAEIRLEKKTHGPGTESEIPAEAQGGHFAGRCGFAVGVVGTHLVDVQHVEDHVEPGRVGVADLGVGLVLWPVRQPVVFDGQRVREVIERVIGPGGRQRRIEPCEDAEHCARFGAAAISVGILDNGAAAVIDDVDDLVHYVRWVGGDVVLQAPGQFAVDADFVAAGVLR
jgi:hypothetical protein